MWRWHSAAICVLRSETVFFLSSLHHTSASYRHSLIDWPRQVGEILVSQNIDEKTRNNFNFGIRHEEVSVVEMSSLTA